MPSNQAAWLTAKAAYPLEVNSAPYNLPAENQIVVKNGAVAINPLDWLLQTMMGGSIFPWLKYPFILGSDLAGEVVEVGKGVTRFKVGDRVLGHAVGTDKRSNESSEGAFQQYTVVRANLASPIPDSMPYTNACVLPLGVSTAACGLFQKDFLALQYPTLSTSRKPSGETLLVWGGSTSVGSNAIQLAVAAGYEVITTASPKNFDHVKSLGAARVFDYRSEMVVEDVIGALKNRQCAGAIAIGNGSIEPCIDIMAASKGRKFIAQASANLPDELPTSAIGMVPVGISYIWNSASVWFRSKVKGVDTKFIWGSELMANEVSRVIYEDYLPAALAESEYIAVPEPQVVGNGLKYVQDALDLHRKGVSAKKVVVSL